jgi:putative oxidoreductase
MARSAGLASLLLRATLGSTMVMHGVRHARSLEGTAGWFDSIGFDQAPLQAKLSAVVEVGSGAALLLGAATPAASSAVIGTLAVAARTVHLDNGYFVVDEGYEYVLALSAAAAALTALGAGPCSVDRALGVESRISGLRGAAFAIAAGLATAAGLLARFWTKPAPADPS